MNAFNRLRHHWTYRYLKLTFGVCASVLAVALVTSVTVDLGSAVRSYAERFGSQAWKRRIHIGKLSIRLLNGRIVVDDFLIEGLEKTDRPFFTAKRLEVALDWTTVLNREVTVQTVEMTDWRMLVERWEDRSNFPKFTRDENEPRGPRRFTTTMKSFRGLRGEFTYDDHAVPWQIVARNVELNITNRPSYRGTMSFSGGTVLIQNYEPFFVNAKSHFLLDSTRIHLDRIEFETDGAQTVASGDVDLGHWPEQTYQFKSHVQFVRMRHIFFKHEKWELGGEGDVAGTFHLFRGGRDLTATFNSPSLGVNAYRFPNLSGALHWTPTLLDVTNGAANFLGGNASFSYSIQPFGSRTPPTARFQTSFSRVNLASFSDQVGLRGLRFAGTARGDRVVLAWPLGRFADSEGSGRLIITPPGGVQMMTGSLTAAREADAEHALHEWGPFAPPPVAAHLPASGDVRFRFDRNLVTFEAGQFATEQTRVTFQGTTAWGQKSQVSFHVTSRDWQESDAVLAGILSDFGSPRKPVTFGGRGEFDGAVTGTFRNPRVEGDFTGEDLRAFDALWGAGQAHVVVENNYVTVSEGTVRRDDSEIRAEGRFSLGYPRDDGGEEINARIRVVRRDMDTLRHAFGIDEYPVSGLLTGEFHLTGEYLRPVGFGGMTLDEFVAYGEPFQNAAASLRFDGLGVRLDNVTAEKGGGSITGAAFIGWDSTYSFNFDGRRIPIEKISRLTYARSPLSGIAEFAANGSATFDEPRNDYKFRVNDLFIGEEGVGQVTGVLALRGTDLSGEIDAASPRLAITATGRIPLTASGESEIQVRFHDMSLDPYVRLFVPRLSPFTTAVASGTLHISGQLTDVDRLRVEGTVETADLRLFDYALRNAAPIRMALHGRAVEIQDLQLVGEDTRLRVSGTIGLSDERIALRAVGDANLGILQGFFRDVRGSGRADLSAAVDGPLRQPVFSGRATINGGRIRHFSLPNSLDAINGVIQFDSNGIRLDELTATLGGGLVQFGGRIGFNGYEPGDLNVRMSGANIQLRYPAGVRSAVDADLSVRGNYRAPVVAGTVTVRNAVYTRRIEEPDLLDLFSRRGQSTGGGAGAEPVVTAVPLRFDIEIIVPSTFRVDNNIARLVANADFFLRGTYDRPSWFGHADVERGDIQLLGRRYRVTKGSIDLVNPTRFEPLFDVEAETNVRVPGQTYRAMVSAVGTPARMNFSVTSDPPLPTADVLTLLFTDVRPNQQDAELRAIQNPQQAATDILTTRATQFLASPLSSEVGRVAEHTFGVDTFQLTPSFINTDTQTSRLNATARLTIGKRISDRAYITFSRSLATSINDQIILLEYDATDRWSWVLSRNEDQQSFALEFRVRHAF